MEFRRPFAALLTDYTRKGFVDGRALRLPTISIRPGTPNAAASSFASGVVREPLNRQQAICPVSPGTRVGSRRPGPRSIAHTRARHRAGGARDSPGAQRPRDLGHRTGDGRRAGACRGAPGLPPTCDGERCANRPDDERLAALDDSRARSLGFPADENFDAMIRQYMEPDWSRLRPVP